MQIIKNNKHLIIVIKGLFSLLIAVCVILSILTKDIPYLVVAMGIAVLFAAVVFAYKSLQINVSDGTSETQTTGTDVSAQLKVLETHLDNSIRQQLEIIPEIVHRDQFTDNNKIPF